MNNKNVKVKKKLLTEFLKINIPSVYEEIDIIF